MGTEPRPKRKRGRPFKYSPELAERICELVRKLTFRTHAARKLGITRMTLRRWVRTRPDFAEKLAEAEAERRDWLLEQVAQAGPGWRFFARLAAKMHPELRRPQSSRRRRPAPPSHARELTREEREERIALLEKLIAARKRLAELEARKQAELLAAPSAAATTPEPEATRPQLRILPPPADHPVQAHQSTNEPEVEEPIPLLAEPGSPRRSVPKAG